MKNASGRRMSACNLPDCRSCLVSASMHQCSFLPRCETHEPAARQTCRVSAAIDRVHTGTSVLVNSVPVVVLKSDFDGFAVLALLFRDYVFLAHLNLLSEPRAFCRCGGTTFTNGILTTASHRNQNPTAVAIPATYISK